MVLSSSLQIFLSIWNRCYIEIAHISPCLSYIITVYTCLSLPLSLPPSVSFHLSPPPSLSTSLPLYLFLSLYLSLSLQFTEPPLYHFLKIHSVSDPIKVTL